MFKPSNHDSFFDFEGLVILMTVRSFITTIYADMFITHLNGEAKVLGVSGINGGVTRLNRLFSIYRTAP